MSQLYALKLYDALGNYLVTVGVPQPTPPLLVWTDPLGQTRYFMY